MAKEKLQKNEMKSPATSTKHKKPTGILSSSTKSSSKIEKNAITKKEKKPKKPKKPKGRVKIVPLIIVAMLIAGIVVCERYFLDTIVKNMMISVIQSEYGAKCDVDSVDLEILDGSFVVEGFALADVSKPMQNLFEFSRASVDFDTTQILLGRFVADELSLEGFMIGTTREISGVLPGIIPEAKPSEDSKEGKFALAFNDTKAEMVSGGTNFIEDLARTYNPENMMSSYLEQLQVPSLVESSQKQVEEIAAYWRGAVPNLEKSGKELFASVEELRDLLNSTTVDIVTITNGINSIQNLVSQSKNLQTQVSNVSTRLEGDIDTVENLSSSIQSAILSDTNLVQNEIAKITSFSFSDAQGLIGSTIEGFFISTLGDYYPIVQKVLTILSNAKADAQEQKREEEKKATERLAGRTIQFNAEMPTFLIRETVFSGSDSVGGLSVSGFAHDISNNPNLLQKPATANLDFVMQEFTGTLDAVVDLRSETDAFPVEVVLTGSGLDTSSLTQSGTIGIPTIGGDADISADVNFELAGDFEVSAAFDFNPALLSVTEFEPSAVYGMYSRVLESVQSFYVQSNIYYSHEEGMSIGVDTNVDKQITDGLAQSLNSEIDALKQNLQTEAQAYLASYTDGFMENVSSFGSDRDSILDLQDGLGSLDGELEKIKAELEQRIKNQAAGAVRDNAQEAASNLLRGFF